MKQPTKTVEIDGVFYQIGRFKLELASYILGRIFNAIPRQQEEAQPQAKEQEKPTPDDLARVMIGAGLFGNMTRATRAEIQMECMRVCSRLEGDQQLPMPLTNGTGLLIDDLGVVLALEREALVFNLTPFFSSGHVEAPKGQPVQNSPTT